MSAVVALLDAIAGASIMAVGILGWRRFRASAGFALAAGVAWFAAGAVPALALLHRPLLLNAVTALPLGGVRGVLPRTLLAVAWAGVVLPPAAQPWVSALTAGLCVAVARGLQNRDGPATEVQPGASAARLALLILAGSMALPLLERVVWPQYAEAGLPVATYVCGVGLACAALLHGILSPSLHETVAIIELSGRTPAESLAALTRMAGSEPDPRRAQALWSAVALLEDNARLQGELAERIEDVRSSRARLIETALAERQRLEKLLTEGALRYLDELERCLPSTGGNVAGNPLVVTCLEEIAHTRVDLEQLSRGLHPRVLVDEGLAAALEDLGRRSPVPIEVLAPTGRFPERTETAIWYACAEALANVWKHARATTAVIRLEESRGTLQATIEDDGVGGARLTAGGGLTGLVDRLSDVDGRLALSSSPAGTTVTITVPLR